MQRLASVYRDEGRYAEAGTLNTKALDFPVTSPSPAALAPTPAGRPAGRRVRPSRGSPGESIVPADFGGAGS